MIYRTVYSHTPQLMQQAMRSNKYTTHKHKHRLSNACIHPHSPETGHHSIEQQDHAPQRRATNPCNRKDHAPQRRATTPLNSRTTTLSPDCAGIPKERAVQKPIGGQCSPHRRAPVLPKGEPELCQRALRKLPVTKTGSQAPQRRTKPPRELEKRAR
jgi:hypothetical protein